MNGGPGEETSPDWLTAGYPERRAGPPWVMSDMVAAERTLPGPILDNPAAADIAASVADALAAGSGVVVTGCGTSEHAARASAALLEEALGDAGPTAFEVRQAFEAALAPRTGGVCIAVSHSGTTGATVAALAAARRKGAVTCLVTAAASSPAQQVADLVFCTPLEDASWCHTVGYLSPVLAAAAIAGRLARAAQPDAAAVSAYLVACDAALPSLHERLGSLAARERLLTLGSGVDAVTAAEQALKIEEGAWVPVTPLHLETLLHGHLPAADERAGLVAFLLDPTCAEERAARTRQALRAARAVGVDVLLITSAEVGYGLAAAHAEDRTVVLPASGGHGLLGALLAGAIALQRITLALAEARGTNPDLLRRDDARYRGAALLAEEEPGGGAEAP